MKVTYSLLISFFVLFIFPIVISNQIFAQTCSGSRVCQNIRVVCTDDITGELCTPGTPDCTCVEVTQSYSVACSGIPPSGTCGGTPCIVGDSVISESCSSTPSCDSSNCFSRTGSDGCEYYGVCSGSSCETGGKVDPSCGVSGGCTPGNYCGGTYCTGCGVGTDVYCGSSGACDDSRTVGGSFCLSCADGCAPGTGNCPVPTSGGGTSTVAPSNSVGTCGEGSHEDSSLCGGCCADGTSCTSVSGGTYVCQGAGGGAYCVENGNFAASAYMDADSNNQQTQPLFLWSSEANIPGAGSIAINYTGRGRWHEIPVGGGATQLTRVLVNGSGVYNDSIDSEYGQISSAYSYTGNLSFTNATSNTLKGANIMSYACVFAAQFNTNQYVAGTGPWPITLDTYQVLFAYQQLLSFGGNIFIDADNDGTKDAGESNYSGATIGISGGGSSATSNSSGIYTFTNKIPGFYTITLTVPSGYVLSSGFTNPRSLIPTNGQSSINFGIRAIPLPACVPASVANSGSSTINPGQSTTLSVTSCTNVENPNDGSPPPPFSWNPDTNGNSPAPTTSGQTDTPTSSTVTWTAPNCPTSTNIYAPRVTVGGSGGTVNYTTSITVPATVSVAAHVRDVTSSGGCTSSSGNPYNNGGTGANLNLTNGGTVNQNQITNGGTGQASFTCLPQGNYTITLAVPSGYSVIGTDVSPAVESPAGSNGLSFATSSNNQTAVFCIAPIDPWFQTDLGDVRFVNLSNPVPGGLLYASSDATYPGIFYSSDSSADFGNAGVTFSSVRQWVINNEYSYNADTENRNGGMSYDFYKSKALKDGVTVSPLNEDVPGSLDWDEITKSGVYEATGDLTIADAPPVGLFDTTNKTRVVILVSEDVVISTNSLLIPENSGLLIVAAKGDITIDETVGTATLTSSASNLDGIYTAQGSIILESIGNGCADGTTSDLRLNVGGALVANSLKPFSTVGTGSIQRNRSLCLDNLTRPSLFISSRPDFLVQMTDFYKISYTKWRESNP